MAPNGLRQNLERHVLLANRADVGARWCNLTARDSLANAKSIAAMKLRHGKMTAEPVHGVHIGGGSSRCGIGASHRAVSDEHNLWAYAGTSVRDLAVRFSRLP
jgi:hypothetical protein